MNDYYHRLVRFAAGSELQSRNSLLAKEIAASLGQQESSLRNYLTEAFSPTDPRRRGRGDDVTKLRLLCQALDDHAIRAGAPVHHLRALCDDLCPPVGGDTDQLTAVLGTDWPRLEPRWFAELYVAGPARNKPEALIRGRALWSLYSNSPTRWDSAYSKPMDRRRRETVAPITYGQAARDTVDELISLMALPPGKGGYEAARLLALLAGMRIDAVKGSDGLAISRVAALVHNPVGWRLMRVMTWALRLIYSIDQSTHIPLPHSHFGLNTDNLCAKPWGESNTQDVVSCILATTRGVLDDPPSWPYPARSLAVETARHLPRNGVGDIDELLARVANNNELTVRERQYAAQVRSLRRGDASFTFASSHGEEPTDWQRWAETVIQLGGLEAARRQVSSTVGAGSERLTSILREVHRIASEHSGILVTADIQPKSSLVATRRRITRELNKLDGETNETLRAGLSALAQSLAPGHSDLLEAKLKAAIYARSDERAAAVAEIAKWIAHRGGPSSAPSGSASRAGLTLEELIVNASIGIDGSERRATLDALAASRVHASAVEAFVQIANSLRSAHGNHAAPFIEQAVFCASYATTRRAPEPRVLSLLHREAGLPKAPGDLPITFEPEYFGVVEGTEAQHLRTAALMGIADITNALGDDELNFFASQLLARFVQLGPRTAAGASRGEASYASRPDQAAEQRVIAYVLACLRHTAGESLPALPADDPWFGVHEWGQKRLDAKNEMRTTLIHLCTER